MRDVSILKIYSCTILSMLMAFMLSSCDLLNPDDDEEIKTPFVANFTNDWLPEDAEGFIVISNTQGQTLDAATWSGNTRIEFEPISDSRIIVTTGTRDAYSNTVYMTSNCYVKPGEWTWKGKPPPLEYNGYATLTFINESEEGGWYRVSGQGNSITRIKPFQDATFSLYVSEDDLCLIQFPDLSIPDYLWVENIIPGESRTIDLATLAAANCSVIAMPPSNEFYYSFLGYHIAGSHYSGSYYLDSQEYYGEVEIQNDLGICYPVETTDIRTKLVHFDSPEHWDGDYWSFYDYGPIPSTMSKINADFTIVNSQPNSFQIDITGTADNVLSNWVGDDGWNQVRWRVFTNPAYTAFALPQMPDSIAISFDLPYSVEFSLENVEILDYPDLNNHEEVIETLFQSDDYFFNIATGGVRIRTKQNDDSAQNNSRAANTPNILKQNDPMIPIPW